jgi:tetratricopeptide (TPR) repeat protein
VINYFTLESIIPAFKACVVGASKLGWGLLGIAALVFIVRSITADVVTIEPISVPKAFAKNGYTADVASQRLRDALNNFAVRTGSSMQSPNLALTSELPKITVPKMEISLDTAAALVRELFHFGNSRDISGEFIQEDNLVWLRVRINGREVYSSANGVDPKKLNDLLDAAAPKVIEDIQPYLVASALYKDNPEQALETADSIITRLPESNINVQWSLILEGNYFMDHGDFNKAETLLRKAIKLNSNNAAAHYNLGVVLMDRKITSEAITEYRRALRIDPSYALAHNNLGVALKGQGNTGAAMAEYRLAIAWSPRYAAAHSNLGVALQDQAKIDEAVNEYRRAIEIDSGYAPAHSNLAVLLQYQGKIDEAVNEYRRAIEIDSRSEAAHVGLANALRNQKKTDEAMIEYRRTLEINPNNAVARINIERINFEAADRNLAQEDKGQ